MYPANALPHIALVGAPLIPIQSTEGPWVRHTKPKPQYAPLFALDRAERFGAAKCYWFPGQVSGQHYYRKGKTATP